MTVAADLALLDSLLSGGATVIDVLPAPTYADEHIPGARSIPLTEMHAASVDGLDRSQPVVVYCYDYQCDLSPRAAARLQQLGFTHVYDFVPGRAAWTADGRPTEGAVGDRDRILCRVRQDVPRRCAGDRVADARSTIGDWELCAVTDDDDVLLGVVRADALSAAPTMTLGDVLVPGPGTVRPDARVTDMAAQLDRDHLEHVLVTTFAGRLVGLLRREDLDAGR